MVVLVDELVSWHQHHGKLVCCQYSFPDEVKLQTIKQNFAWYSTVTYSINLTQLWASTRTKKIILSQKSFIMKDEITGKIPLLLGLIWCLLHIEISSDQQSKLLEQTSWVFVYLMLKKFTVYKSTNVINSNNKFID